MINVTVDDTHLEVAGGATVLDAVRAAGVDLPTLCHHEGLKPYGACRLCMVSVERPAAGLAAACVHPAEEGMVVRTDTGEAVGARRLAMEFILGRCPQAPAVRRMADAMGLSESRFPAPADEHDPAQLCMLCGLCVRVCHEVIGAGAISFIGRGAQRRVGTPFEVHAEACIGCGACAEICPTGAVRMEDRGGRRILHTWNTSVELARCERCGRPFAPAGLEFLKQRFAEVQELWHLCPDCRAARTAAQYLDAHPKGGRL